MAILLTDHNTGSPVTVDIKDIDAYRGNTGYTSIYHLNGDVTYVSEDFDTVDSLIESEVTNGN